MENQQNEKKSSILLLQFEMYKSAPTVFMKNKPKYKKNNIDKLNIFDNNGIIEMFYLDSRTIFDDKKHPAKIHLLDDIPKKFIEIELNDNVQLEIKKNVNFGNKIIEEKLFIGQNKKLQSYELFIHIDLMDFAFEKSQCEIVLSPSKYLDTQSYFHINNNLTIIKDEKFLCYNEFIDSFKEEFELAQNKIKNLFYFSNIELYSTLTEMNNTFQSIQEIYKKINKGYDEIISFAYHNWDTTKITSNNIEKTFIYIKKNYPQLYKSKDFEK